MIRSHVQLFKSLMGRYPGEQWKIYEIQWNFAKSKKDGHSFYIYKTFRQYYQKNVVINFTEEAFYVDIAGSL